MPLGRKPEIAHNDQVQCRHDGWATGLPRMIVSFRRLTMAIALLLCAPAGALPAVARFDAVEALAIEQLAATDPAAAVSAIDAALAGAPDAAIREALLRRKADLQAELADRSGRLATLTSLAEAIAARAGENAPELMRALIDVAEAARAADDEALEAEALGHALRIADAGGDNAAAARIAARLETLAGGPGDDLARSALAEHGEAQTRDLSTGEAGFTRVRLYYATDRKREGGAPADFYGGRRGDRLELGIADVSVPLTHQAGQIEKPSIWTLDFREDPERHIVLRSVTPMDDADVFAAMRRHIAGTGSNEAFVFVHGFNVTFENAARRAAQIAHDMNFAGLPILYSWPSAGSIFSYIADTAAVNLSGRRLSVFLDDVVRQSGATRIHLIAHSMGNRALTDALELYALRHAGEPPAFEEVLFTAPDLDAGLFAAMARTIRPAARRLTLYASEVDWALAVSRRLHGDQPRAGQGGADMLISPDFDSVDMSAVGEDMLAHSYFANNPSALTDILSLFWRDTPPQQRCGMSRGEGPDGFYVYEPERCDSNAMLAALVALRAPGGSEGERPAISGGTLAADEVQRIDKALDQLLAKPESARR